MNIELCGTMSNYRRHLRAKEKPCEKCAEVAREYGQKWRKANPEKVKVNRQRSYALETPEKRAKSRRNYYKSENYKKLCAAQNRRRRAQKLQNGYEVYTVEQVLELYGSDCHICKQPINLTAPKKTGKPGWQMGLHIDHVIPISQGGSDTLQNVKPAHAICNVTKK